MSVVTCGGSGLGCTLALGYGLRDRFALARSQSGLPYRRTAGGWGGNGGSWVHIDMDARMTVAFVMNRWIDGLDLGRCFDVVNAAYDSLGMRS